MSSLEHYLAPIKAETDREGRDRKKTEAMNASIARWKVAETELSTDQTPIGGLKRAFIDHIKRDNSTQGAFSQKGYFPGVMEMHMLWIVNQVVEAWVGTLPPEQKEVLFSRQAASK